MNKIEKELKKTSDERAILENGKIYKKILETIIILTNIVYLICLYFLGGLVKNIPLNIVMFIINFSTFIGVIKTLKIGTFEGSISIVTYTCSTYYTLNILGIIWGILDIVFKSHYLVADYMFLIGLPIAIITDIVQIIYINKKIKKLS